jgi:hypothetical protein
MAMINNKVGGSFREVNTGNEHCLNPAHLNKSANGRIK